MESGGRRRVKTGLGAAVAVALLVWRYFAPAWHPIYLDFLFWVVVHAAYTAVRLEKREWPLVTAGLMVALSALYLKGQVPQALWALDLLP